MGCGKLRRERATLTGHTGSIFSLTLSTDGSILASAGRREIRFWDVASRQQIGNLSGGKTDLFYAVSFSPDGSTLASGVSDGTIRLWDEASGREKATLTGHESSVFSVAFSPDGSTLGSGTQDATVRLWDVNSRKEIGVRYRTCRGCYGCFLLTGWAGPGQWKWRRNDSAMGYVAVRHSSVPRFRL